MLTLRCSVTGSPYEPRSFSDFVHQYIDASPDELSSKLEQLFKRPEWLVQWYEGLLAELEVHFADFVDRTGPTGKSSPEFHAWMNKWNQLGITVGSKGQPDFAERLYKLLLSKLRVAQSRWGWIHKGMIYHQIGWSKLVMGKEDEVEAARDYFVTAALEDILLDLDTSAQAEAYHGKPAARVLSSVYQTTSQFFQELIGYAKQTLSVRDRQVDRLLLENADLLHVDV